MKNIYLLIFSLLFTSSLFSQSIRKNFREMTVSEKINLVNAFYELRFGADLINDLSNFHSDFFNFDNTISPERLDIHKNLPDEPDREIFLAWHRRQMLELEHAMQNINPNISIPFVDWGVEDSIDSPLWDDEFMGQFNDDWNLNRNFGAFSRLPTPIEIQDVQEVRSDFFSYSNTLERSLVHAGPHAWIGGVMGGGSSPRDPVFYLHHTFIDKLWNDWEKINGGSSYLRFDMLRYDGTYMFNGNILPLTNPNDIVDSKSLGVFYAENKLVSLENYEISNTFSELENFYYQYTIEIGNSFKIPNGKSGKVESVNKIVLKPGFFAEKGSSFLVKIDDLDILKSSIKGSLTVVSNQILFDEDINANQNIYDNFSYNDFKIIFNPNPFRDIIILRSEKNMKSGSIIIYDIIGNHVFTKFFKNLNYIEIRELKSLSNGIYFLQVINENQMILNTKIIKQ